MRDNFPEAGRFREVVSDRILDSVETTPAWAGSTTGRSVVPIVHLLDRIDETGVRPTKSAFRPIAERLRRSATLSEWSVAIQPASG